MYLTAAMAWIPSKRCTYLGNLEKVSLAPGGIQREVGRARTSLSKGRLYQHNITRNAFYTFEAIHSIDAERSGFREDLVIVS